MVPNADRIRIANSIAMIKPDANILLITGLDASHELVRDALKKGPNVKVLHKPFTLDVLGEMLESLGI